MRKKPEAIPAEVTTADRIPAAAEAGDGKAAQDTLAGKRREMTREMFEELGGLQ